MVASKAVLILGSNSGDNTELIIINKALNLIQELAGKIILESAFYQTSPWGYEDQPDFLNKVVVIETYLKPSVLLKTVKSIEKELGRVKSEKWQQRIIDIDILFYDSLVLTTKQLTIPHPLLHERKFTLIPLKEIMPDYVHPVFKKRIAELADHCKDRGVVKKMINDYTRA